MDAGRRPIVVVSNRGPVSFRRDGDQLRAKRGGGGLVSGLGPLVAGTDTVWIAAAMSDDDRAAASGAPVDADGFRARLLALDPVRYRQAYDVVCNATLWFAHHGLFELARRPRIDTRWRQAWDSYRYVNEQFATAVAHDAPVGAAVLVQDYHLCLLAPMLAEQRPDLRLVHFSHTPFATPDGLRVLPSDVRHELLAGMAAHAACGFHTARWARGFEACCDDTLGWVPTTFVSPLASDLDDLRSVAAGPECATAADELDAAVGNRRFVLRVDRIELSKNLLRGFWAFDDLLTRHPEWRGAVTFGAFVYPSREGLPEYLAYRQEVDRLVQDLNSKWATPDWTPILFDPTDHFPRSVAALRRFDVLLVNPIRDGLNLVASEGVLLNERDGAIALSTEAGAFEYLRSAVIPVEPFDVSGTADALHLALTMPAAERARRATAARDIALSRSPADWLRGQLDAAG
ncbi:MAG TPA: trehalose-6-phosphate synthase [Acidimicrobiales bacterium]|jgi:trehalose 6-phosphate synthase|nr:trehalose-6-phosphate synthase [Acidimicrobiales bacterium]